MIIKDLCKEYIKNKRTINILNNLNYNFNTGKMYAIFGQSGCGKTTLINILGILDFATSGEYIFEGKEISKLNSIDRVNLRIKNIGYVFQDINLSDYLTAFENVELPMIVNKDINVAERESLALRLLKKFGLEDRKNHYPNELSGGEKQRVCIARALANNPKYILCDEPTSSLDKKNTLKIFGLLKELANDGYCVIVVSHDERVFDFADICLELSDGKLYEVKNEVE